MTATPLPVPALEPRRRSALGWAIADTRAIAWRNLVTLRRVPQLLVFSTIQPVIFVLLFRYVFGGATHRRGQRTFGRGGGASPPTCGPWRSAPCGRCPASRR